MDGAVHATGGSLVTSVLWLRRDLRLTDHPALLTAHDEGEVLPLVVLGPGQVDDERPPGQRLRRSLAALRHEVEPVAPEQLAHFVPVHASSAVGMRRPGRARAGCELHQKSR